MAMLTGESVVCLSSIDWDFSWQGHQQIMSVLAAQGNRVLFIETTGVRPTRWSDLPRLRARLRNWRRGTAGVRREREGLWVYSPVAVPLPYSRVARWLNRTTIGRVIRGWIRDTGGGRPILWTFLPTPLTRALSHDLDPALTVYYCVDDLPASSPGAARIEASEVALFRSADLVFVTAERLRARALRYRGQADVFPFGVAGEIFARGRGEAEPPADLRGLPRPLVAYVGGINLKLDRGFLAAVARSLPEMTFVLIGPIETAAGPLEAVPNLRLLGSRPHAELPRYLRECAVGLVPYRLTRYTAHVYPSKLNEYLAMGLPVVSTPLPEVTQFNLANGDLIAIASDPASFARAIRRAVQDTSPEAIRRRVEAAGRNDWTPRIAALSGLVEAALVRRRAGA
jgi:glycosyltransferase involved in cell wall biosynthesis